MENGRIGDGKEVDSPGVPSADVSQGGQGADFGEDGAGKKNGMPFFIVQAGDENGSRRKGMGVQEGFYGGDTDQGVVDEKDQHPAGAGAQVLQTETHRGGHVASGIRIPDDFRRGRGKDPGRFCPRRSENDQNLVHVGCLKGSDDQLDGAPVTEGEERLAAPHPAREPRRRNECRDLLRHGSS